MKVESKKKKQRRFSTLNPQPSAFILLFAVLCLLLISANTRAAQGEEGNPAGKIAVFPFDNFSDEKNALSQIMPFIKGFLEKKGFEVLDDDSLNAFLLKERIRATGYISRELAQKMEKELRVKAVLLGSVNMFFAQGSPMLGLSARLVDTSSGFIQWANSASATGDDFTSILGLGRIEDMNKLIPKVAGRLLASFSATPLHKEIESTYRIAVMPFQNKSRARDAGMIISYIVIGELFKNPRFFPVEFGDIRKSVVDLRIRNKGELDYKSIESMSGLIDADGVLVGTVESYSDRVDSNVPPEVVVSMRLIDARKKKILWYDSYQLNGDETITVFDWGKMRSVDQVACKVVTKLIQRMEKTKWY